jgi:hypothetical protein
MDTTNEPVAWLVQYRDRHEFRWKKPEHLYEALACEPLYTHPNEHDLGIAEAVGFDRGYQAATARSQESDSYGDGTVYRGVRSKDSEVKTYVFDEHAGNKHGPSQQRHRLMILSTKTIWVMYHLRGLSMHLITQHGNKMDLRLFIENQQSKN